MITKEHGMYVLRARETGRVLGRHPSRARALRQERAINLSKARAAGYLIPYRRAKPHPFASRGRHTHHARSR